MAEPAPASSNSGVEPSTSHSSGSSDVLVGEERKDSCVPKFDALWFCYCESAACQCMRRRGADAPPPCWPQAEAVAAAAAAARLPEALTPPRLAASPRRHHLQRRRTSCSSTT
jgi:hypothetical protein